ncbi:MAG: cytochrome c [Chitinophagaceae bacterium]
MKKLVFLAIMALTIVACGSNTDEKKGTDPAASPTSAADQKEPAGANPSYDPKRGEGKFSNVQIAATLDAAKAEAGSKIFSVKCSSCHKTTDEKLVGPGWKGVTGRHTAEWIMNFATNPDVMIDKDPKAQAMLELCLVRMPNQNLTDDDARNIYEFMRKNDGVK